MTFFRHFHCQRSPCTILFFGPNVQIVEVLHQHMPTSCLHLSEIPWTDSYQLWSRSEQTQAQKSRKTAKIAFFHVFFTFLPVTTLPIHVHFSISLFSVNTGQIDPQTIAKRSCKGESNKTMLVCLSNGYFPKVLTGWFSTFRVLRIMKTVPLKKKNAHAHREANFHFQP